MSTTKTWGPIGAWAAESEAAEAEERAAAAAAGGTAATADTESFPSLKEAASAKPKKKKGVTMPSRSSTAPHPLRPRGLTVDLMTIRAAGAAKIFGFRADAFAGRRETRLVLEPRKADAAGALPEPAKTTKPSPFGAARPREEVLAEKGMDWRRLEAEIETKKTSRPTSSHSSRPSSAHSSRAQSPTRHLGVPETVVKPRQKVNPFGEAKPREVILQEQGKDWKKIDFELEHRGVDRPETEEEKMLKEQINLLNEDLTKDNKANDNGESDQLSPEDLDTVQQKKDNLERELEHLSRELDDKVRFGQKANDRRPGSGSGRLSIMSDRPSSQSGASEDARSTEFTERPRSRGGGETRGAGQQMISRERW
ncbi:unnamed protein product [Spirodela intermedia]|uniref:Uncharacterized protein n=1 Tax=Spirodela intermedia TaxID=51605 RepID=A0A7I8JDG0_SPIIN|nr:unnamed protein product [Spirodela intermedia]CAA6668031.1 unnamed protein product [Spirodela intermedia]